jgi:hypothetical protein
VARWYHVKEIRFSGIAVAENAITMNQDAAGSLLEIVIDDKPGMISGTVTEGDKPVRQPIVLAIKWSIASAGRGCGRKSDDRGNFQIAGLAPGEYRVSAISPIVFEARTRLINDTPPRLINSA